MDIKRRTYYKPEEVIAAVDGRLKTLEERGEVVDYVTFVPDGEPTLDLNIGAEIREVKDLGVKVAVITNSSLLWMEDVREDLLSADFVSLKVDALSPKVWLRINRPHKSLNLQTVLSGILMFSKEFSGIITTETMLVRGVNDSPTEALRIADFLSRVSPKTTYISVPTRPPTESWVRPPSPEALNSFYQVFRERGLNAEFLVSFEGTNFSTTGNAREDILSITSVHPLREDALRELLRKAGADWSVVDELIRDGNLVVVVYGGWRYFLRNLGSRRTARALP